MGRPFIEGFELLRTDDGDGSGIVPNRLDNGHSTIEEQPRIVPSKHREDDESVEPVSAIDSSPVAQQIGDLVLEKSVATFNKERRVAGLVNAELCKNGPFYCSPIVVEFTFRISNPARSTWDKTHLPT